MAQQTIHLQAAAAGAVLRAPRWWELANLRRLAEGKAIGYSCGPKPEAPEYAFLALDSAGARRFFLVLPDVGLVCCDVAEPGTRWVLEGRDPKLTERTVLQEEGAQVHVLLSAAGVDVAPVSNVDMVGMQAGRRVAVFHRGLQMQNSAVHFEARDRES